MNHQRGWQDNGRSDMGREGEYRSRYRGESDRYFGRGERDRGYDQGSWRTTVPYGMDEDQNDLDYRRRQEREEMGRTMGRSNYQGRYNPSSGWGAGYGDVDYSNTRDRDDMGRFISRSGYEGQYGRGEYGGMNEYRGGMGSYGGSESYGRMGTSGVGMQGSYGGQYDQHGLNERPSESYRSGMGGFEQERDSMGRFTGQHRGGQGRQRMQGPHSGRGPKNYQRSEERVKEDVSERLEDDGFLDASEIEIKVQNGIVSLTGTVESREAKRRAEEIAEDCPGVKDVQNQLRVSGTSHESGREKHEGGTSHQSGQQHQSTRKNA